MATTSTSALSTLYSDSTASSTRSASTSSFTELNSTATYLAKNIAIRSAIHVVDLSFEYAHRIYDFLLNKYAVIFVQFFV